MQTTPRQGMKLDSIPASLGFSDSWQFVVYGWVTLSPLTTKPKTTDRLFNQRIRKEKKSKELSTSNAVLSLLWYWRYGTCRQEITKMFLAVFLSMDIWCCDPSSVTPCCATEICKSVSEGHTHWQNTWKLKVVRFAYFLPDRIFIFVSSLKSQPLQQVTFPILTALLYGIVTNWIPTKLMFSRLWSAVRCSSDYCNVLVYLSWYKLETHSPRN
jgi:hypothetical protein